MLVSSSTAVPERFHHINSSVCFTLGCAFNGLLLWLLAKHTGKEMAFFRPILAVTTLTAVACLGIALVVQLVVITHAGYSAAISVGPLGSGQLPRPATFALLMLWVMSMLFYNSSFTMVFAIRYLIICREKNYSSRRFVTLLVAVPLAVAMLWGGVILRTCYVSTPEMEHEARGIFFGPSNNESSRMMDVNSTNDYHEQRSYVISHFRRPGNNALSRLMMAYNILTYSAITFLMWRIYRHLMNMAEGHMDGGQYRELQLQLSSTLLMQSITPLVAVVVPTISYTVAGYAGWKVQNISTYLTAVTIWEMALNPLIAIWVIRAYREVVFGWARKVWSGMTRKIFPSKSPPPTNFNTRTIALSQHQSGSAADAVKQTTKPTTMMSDAQKQQQKQGTTTGAHH